MGKLECVLREAAMGPHANHRQARVNNHKHHTNSHGWFPPETPTRGAHFLQPPQPPQPPQFCFLLPFLQTLISPCFSSSSNPNPNSSSHLHSDSHMLPESMINPRPSTDYSSHHRLLEILKPSDANPYHASEFSKLSDHRFNCGNI